MNELILILIMLATTVYVTQPYWRRQPGVKSNKGNGYLRDLIEKRDSLLAAIKEIEFDHETGKVSAEDFAEINARYRSEAIAILQRIDAVRGNERSNQRLEAELRELRSRRRKGLKFCSQCGNSVGLADRFCSNCGNPLTV